MLNFQNKNKIIQLISLVFLVFLSGLFFNLKPAKADVTEFTVYSLMTPDTTPIIKGTVSDANAHITIDIDGPAPEDYHATYDFDADGTNWSITIPDGNELIVDEYAISASATSGNTMDTNALLDVFPPELPLEIYYIISELDEYPSVISMEFLADFPDFRVFLADPDSDPGFSVNISEGTMITPSEGNAFPFLGWNMESLNPSNNDLLRVIEFGIPNLGLNFSHPIDISVDIDASYNGRTLNIFTRESIDGTPDGWESVGTCLVTDGSCNFSVNHASFFGISEHNNLGDDHRGGLVYKKYKEYKEKFKNKEDKQRYFKIKWLKKNQKETYLYYKSVYEEHKSDSDSEFNKLSAEIKEIYKNYRGYNGYKNYREYKKKVY